MTKLIVAGTRAEGLSNSEPPWHLRFDPTTSQRLNACQFSFACDGKPDVPDDMRAWNTALNITTLALTNDKENLDQQMQIVANATYYHADYVDPSWSKSLHRLTKIGRHIFYFQG